MEMDTCLSNTDYDELVTGIADTVSTCTDEDADPASLKPHVKSEIRSLPGFDIETASRDYYISIIQQQRVTNLMEFRLTHTVPNAGTDKVLKETARTTLAGDVIAHLVE